MLDISFFTYMQVESLYRAVTALITLRRALQQTQHANEDTWYNWSVLPYI
jgi:hypothetical protein